METPSSSPKKNITKVYKSTINTYSDKKTGKKQLSGRSQGTSSPQIAAKLPSLFTSVEEAPMSEGDGSGTVSSNSR